MVLSRACFDRYVLLALYKDASEKQTWKASPHTGLNMCVCVCASLSLSHTHTHTHSLTKSLRVQQVRCAVQVLVWKTNFDQLSPSDVLSAQRPRDRSEATSRPASVPDVPSRTHKGRAPTSPISVCFPFRCKLEGEGVWGVCFSFLFLVSSCEQT